MTDENKLLLSHIDDLIASVKKGRRYAFSSFLSIDQLSVVYNHIRGTSAEYGVFGGYEDAERCIVGLGSDGVPEEYVYPITVLAFDLKGNGDITHRHVLGSLMSLGIKRECIGDILFFGGMCCFFADSKMADYICMNLVSVSGMHVDVAPMSGEIQFTRSFEEISCIVASMRLDCIIGELANRSRTSATELVESGMVFINGVQCQKKDKSVAVGDVISIRRVGKFRIDREDGVTKKNRIKLKILKYI